MLRILTLKKSYGGHDVLKDVSFEIGDRDKVALVGPNGAGKSSLLKVIAGEAAPDAGSVWRAPGIRISRLEQDVPAAGARAVFDEVADGLGTLGELVAT